MVRLHVSNVLKIFRFKMHIYHFQKMRYDLDVGGGCGSGPVFLISAVSYQYIVFIYYVCIHCLYPRLWKSWETGYLPGGAFEYATMNVFALRLYARVSVCVCMVCVACLWFTYKCEQCYDVCATAHSLTDHSLDKRRVREPRSKGDGKQYCSGVCSIRVHVHVIWLSG